MARVSVFVLLVVLLFLVGNERSSGLPTKIQSNDRDFEEKEGVLNQDERKHIRQILMLAAKEIRDEDIIQVLKKSLILRLKICFSSPLPSLPPQEEFRTFGETHDFAETRDEGLSPDQKHRLHKVLKEALEHIDEEEVLEFLKSSLYFRLLFCLYNPLEGPFPEPGPSPGGHANKPTPSQSPGLRLPTTGPDTNQTNFVSPSSSLTEPSNETTGKTLSNEDKGGSTESDVPDLPEVALKDAISSISSWNETPDLDVDDLPSYDGAEVNRDSSKFLVNGHDSSVQSAELEGLKARGGLEKTSLVESSSDNGDITKLSQSLSNGKLESTTIEESDEANDGVLGATSDGVGKAAFRAEKQSMESVTANSDEGEFQSVITIDYDALADEEKTGTGGVDLSPIEPNELLSL